MIFLSQTRTIILRTTNYFNTIPPKLRLANSIAFCIDKPTIIIIPFSEKIDLNLTTDLIHTEKITSSLDPNNPCNYDATNKGKRGDRTYEPIQKKKSAQTKYHYLVALHSLKVLRNQQQLTYPQCQSQKQQPQKQRYWRQ